MPSAQSIQLLMLTHKIRCIPIAAALVAVLSAASAPSSQDNTATSQHSMGSRKHYAGLSNFGEVTPNLYRGGQPGADGLKALKKMGVSIVIDMRGNRSQHEQRAVEELGMEYISIPWHCPFPSDNALAKFLKVIEQNPGKKIFVHCRLGNDRTGMAIASYRMADEGWSADEAMKEMKLFGYRGIHRVICPTLPRYEKDFPKHLETNPLFQELHTSRK